MSQPQMNMGGPVGGQQMNNAGTPNSGGAIASAADSIKRLNTAIYDHLLRNSQYDVARVFLKHNDIDTKMKDSPSQRGNQPNGVDDGMDGEYKDRPDDLPMPGAPFGDGPFLADWWLSFWDIWQGHRGKSNKNSTLSYISAQRQVTKARAMGGTMDPSTMQNMRGPFTNGVMPNMNSNMVISENLKRAAMANRGNMTPQQLQQVQARNAQAMQQNQQAIAMERQASQMDMSGPRSGSPGSGDAPSPKRQRLDGGGIQQMTQGRPGPPGPMPGQVGPPNNIPEHVLQNTQDLLRQRGIDPSTMTLQQLQSLAQQPANHQLKSAETYRKSLHQSMSAQLSQAANSNLNKGMPQNTGMVPAGQQGSPMSQVGVDSSDFYATPNGTRMVNPANVPNNGMGQNGNQTGGNHALQDYQMQLMLLEQQNKKRLLMARQEQDNMVHPGIPGGVNGQFAPPGMSPQNNRAGDPSPNPMDMQRGTPKLSKPGMSPNGDMVGRNSPAPNMQMDPSHIPPQFRQQVMPNGAMRPPSSHPMAQMTPEQMRIMQQSGQMMQNVWQPGQQPPPGMMTGQQQGQGMPPGQGPPNMTPRQGNNQQMPPPPPPAGGAGGTQPSSPAQPPAPPTPSQGNKPKPGGKKEPAKKGSNKKGMNASESDQPPTPTPATPITPMNAKSFNNGQQMSNGQPGLQNGVQQVPQGVGQPDMGGAPFGIPGNLDGTDQFSNMSMEFGNLDGGDVLDSFDFDSFLNTGGDDGLSGFDANMMFDGSIEAGGDMGN